MEEVDNLGLLAQAHAAYSVLSGKGDLAGRMGTMAVFFGSE